MAMPDIKSMADFHGYMDTKVMNAEHLPETLTNNLRIAYYAGGAATAVMFGKDTDGACAPIVDKALTDAAAAAVYAHEHAAWPPHWDGTGHGMIGEGWECFYRDMLNHGAEAGAKDVVGMQLSYYAGAAHMAILAAQSTCMDAMRYSLECLQVMRETGARNRELMIAMGMSVTRQ